MKRLAFILLTLLIAAPLLSSAAVVYPAFNVPFLKAALPATGSGPYVPETAYFAGDGQCYVQLSTALWTSDQNQFYASFWIKPDAAGINTGDSIYGMGNDGTRIHLNSANVIHFQAEDAASTQLIDIRSTATITRDGNTWTHVLIRVDRTVDDQGQIYINGVEGTSIVTFLSTAEDADPIDCSSTAVAVGSEFGGADYGGCLADFWCSMGNTYANIVIGDFYVGGNPVDLGATGAGPDGAQPRLFLKGSGTGFTANSGSAGNFTKMGTTALTTCSDAP